jgi:diguanylate cyclase (GGDEF)-like protein/PAS domain S-box-containing protein
MLHEIFRIGVVVGFVVNMVISDVTALLSSKLELLADYFQAQACLILGCAENSLVPLPVSFGINNENLEALKLLNFSLTGEAISAPVVAMLKGETIKATLSEGSIAPYPYSFTNLSVTTELAVPLILDNKPAWVCILINPQRFELDSHQTTLITSLCYILQSFELKQQLDFQKNRYQALLDAAVDGFIEVDNNKRIIYFTKGAESLTGWDAKEAIGLTCSEVLRPRTEKNKLLCETCPLDRAFRLRTPVTNIDAMIHTRDGEDSWASCSYNVTADAKGQIVGGVIAIKDIYRVKALSEELKEELRRQQSLLGVINAINGLSNIEEIYRRALSEIASAIDFDIGTIHSYNPDHKTLTLMSVFEPKHRPEDTDYVNYAPRFTTVPRVLDFEPQYHYTLVEEDLETKDVRTLGLEDYDEPESNIIKKTIPVTNCEALSQNEPYMAVNLPGKPICSVLAEYEGLQAHMCVPIKVQDTTFGVLHLASHMPYAFLGGDLTLAHSIAKQIAVAAERAYYIEQLDKQASTDALTGLYNKRELWKRLNIELRRAERKFQPLSFMMIDLDNLKWFNDYFGHTQGDNLISNLGRLIFEKCRASDIAFRYGGDELCLLLPDTERDAALVVAERLRQDAQILRVSYSEEDIVIGGDYTVTLSIGIATFPYDAQSVSDLFEKADAAMYRAKTTGKNKVCVYDAEVDSPKPNFDRRRLDR